MTDFDLDGFLPYQINVLAGRLSREFGALYRDRFGISIPEWRVLAHLGQAGRVSVREIYARVDMDKSKVSRAAARLESAGYITKTQSRADRRLVDMALTDKGRALMAELAPIAEAFEAELTGRLGEAAPDFRAAVRRLLET
jgi:DNA-binding MarR family transcriptional regulator